MSNNNNNNNNQSIAGSPSRKRKQRTSGINDDNLLPCQRQTTDEFSELDVLFRETTKEIVPSPPQRHFSGTTLPMFCNFNEAIKQLREIREGLRGKQGQHSTQSILDYPVIFAFDANFGGSKMQVIGNYNDFLSICYERKIFNRFIDYHYEYIEADKRQKLYCDIEYYEENNPDKDSNAVLSAIEAYIKKTYNEIPNRPLLQLDDDAIWVETCHRDGKQSWHIKLKERAGVVKNMMCQRTFWTRVIYHAKQDLKGDDEELRRRAENLRIFDKQNLQVWVIDFTVYKEKHQLFRNLKASKYPLHSQRKHYMVPIGRSADSITKVEWLDSLVMFVSHQSCNLNLADSWFELDKKALVGREKKTLRAEGVSDQVHDSTGISNVSEDMIKASELLLKEINSEWTLPDANKVKITYIYANKFVDLLPRKVRIVPVSRFCPIKGSDHSTNATCVDIEQNGNVSICCLSNNHKDQHGHTIWNLDPSTHMAAAAFLTQVWGVDKWNTIFNSRFAFLNEPRMAKKPYLEHYIQDNSDGRKVSVVRYNAKADLKERFFNCRAYSLTAKFYEALKAPSSTQPQRQQSNEETPSRGKQKRKGSLWKKKDPFSVWLKSNWRRCFDRAIFEPTTCDPYNPTSSERSLNGNFNLWDGFAVQPKPAENPAPLLRKHLFEVLVSENQQHYDFLINLLAWMVQRPNQKTHVVVVFKSKQGTGKSLFLDSLLKIFGKYSIHITHRDHFFSQFNGFLETKTFIALNESTWGGDKLHEGLMKSAVTDQITAYRSMFSEVREGVNYWNMMILSNNDWCYPAGLDNRRFFDVQVSEKYIGDKDYFDKLHEERDNGGVEEFFYFLLKHQIPAGWAPYSALPKQTKGLWNSILADRSNSALKWFLAKIGQGEWIHETSAIGNIQYEQQIWIIKNNEPNCIKARDFISVLQDEIKDYPDIRNYGKLGNISQLKDFFTKTLELPKELFCDDNIRISSNRTRVYRFDSMENIKKFVENKFKISIKEDGTVGDMEDKDDNETERRRKKSKSTNVQTSHEKNTSISGMVKYLESIHGNEGMSISEASNHSEGMSIENYDSNGPDGARYARGSQTNEKNLLSNEELTSQHSLMDCLFSQGAEVDEDDSILNNVDFDE